MEFDLVKVVWRKTKPSLVQRKLGWYGVHLFAFSVTYKPIRSLIGIAYDSIGKWHICLFWFHVKYPKFERWLSHAQEKQFIKFLKDEDEMFTEMEETCLE